VLGAFPSGLARAGFRPGNDLPFFPLDKLSKLMHRGEITSLELVELYLDRINKEEAPGGVNAYITVAGEQALRQARVLDRLAAQGKFLGPLHGLPIAIKDNLETLDMPTTGGTSFLAGWRPKRDAYVVDKLRKAGAVVIGKTNLHELAMGVTTNNPHYGPTRNPYNPDRIPGGSSGGSAAAAAVGLCAGALGTDTGGSVRIPAALCGVVGLKPTLGRVGRNGLMYLSFTCDAVGPITRTVGGAAMLLEAMAGGPDPGDPESSARPVPNYMSGLKGDLRGKRFGVPRWPFYQDLHQDTAPVVEEALQLIRDRGGVLREVIIPDMDLVRQATGVIGGESGYLLNDYLRKVDPNMDINDYLDELGPEVRKLIVGRGGDGSKAASPPSDVYLRALRQARPKFIAGFQAAMDGPDALDALVMPTTPIPPPLIGEDETMELGGKRVHPFVALGRNTVPFNVTGWPAISVPAGLDRNGLPVGMQLVARPWDEAELLDLAYGFERAVAGK
jgi:aspartyl-tRNA(Asn)/glutamyl-tRNA(Gln) amidotransferase subunit A